MEAGKLGHRITIQQATVAQDAYGEPVKTWGTLATVWAAVEPLIGREYLAVQQIQSAVSVRVRIRYRSGITPLMRVQWVDSGTTRIFDIESVQEVRTERRELILMCKDVQDG